MYFVNNNGAKGGYELEKAYRKVFKHNLKDQGYREND